MDYFKKATNAMGEKTRTRKTGTTRDEWNSGVASRRGVPNTQEGMRATTDGQTVTGADGVTRVYDAAAKRWRIQR
jgi:hypothetical protein